MYFASQQGMWANAQTHVLEFPRGSFIFATAILHAVLNAVLKSDEKSLPEVAGFRYS